jgi:hypothetical protein
MLRQGFVTDLKGNVIANISTIKTQKIVKPGAMVSFKYRFTPELEPGALGFGIWF